MTYSRGELINFIHSMIGFVVVFVAVVVVVVMLSSLACGRACDSICLSNNDDDDGSQIQTGLTLFVVCLRRMPTFPS